MSHDSIAIVADKRTPMGWVLPVGLGLALRGLENAYGGEVTALAMEIR